MSKVVFTIGSLFGGGAERVVSVWSSALAEKGYDVSVIVHTRMENEYPMSEKVSIFSIEEMFNPKGKTAILKRIFGIRKILKKLKPDVVISFLPNMQMYVRISSFGLRIKKIETLRSNFEHAEEVKNKKQWMKCFEKGDAVILQTEGQKEFFGKDVQEKSVVIPNPISKVFAENCKEEYVQGSHKIVATGRLVWQKDYMMMIDAVEIVAKKYRDVSLQIYGKGPLQNDLVKYIEEKNLQRVVEFKGRSNDLANIYKKADLYLLSSKCEGMPNALAEAMAIGLPCVSTDCKTGPKDLIDDGVNGYLVKCGDAEAMAEKIIEVFEKSSEEQKEMGQRARQKIINFCGENNSLDKLVNLIEKVVSSSK